MSILKKYINEPSVSLEGSSDLSKFLTDAGVDNKIISVILKLPKELTKESFSLKHKFILDKDKVRNWDDFDKVIKNIKLLSPDEIIQKTNEFRKLVPEKGLFSLPRYNTGAKAFPDPSKLVVVAISSDENGLGKYLYLDYDPDKNGHSGQLSIFSTKGVTNAFVFEKDYLDIIQSLNVNNKQNDELSKFEALETNHGGNDWINRVKYYQKTYPKFKLPDSYIKWVTKNKHPCDIVYIWENGEINYYVSYEDVEGETIVDAIRIHADAREEKVFKLYQNIKPMKGIKGYPCSYGHFVIGYAKGTSDSGVYLFIDMDPASGGKKGQVCELVMDYDELRLNILADSFDEYLGMLEKAEEAGVEQEGISLEEETKPEEPTSDDTNTEEETQDETTDNESPDESQTDDQADITETPPEEDTGSNGEDDTESDQTTSEETSEDEERREERRETRREEVRLDNPEDEKVKISSYLEPLLGDQISELTLFSAAEINRPLYHVSMNPSIERFTPQVSKRTLGKEDRSVPRISTSTSLIGCLNGYQSMVSDMEGRAAKNFNGLFKVYELPYQYAVKPSRKLLSDVENSDEYWLVSWKKETYATYPIQIADFTIPKIEKVFGADGKDETFHVYIKVTNGTLYIDHQRKLEKGYYHMTMKGYTFKYPLKNNNLITIENITENEYNKVTALSMMIKKR